MMYALFEVRCARRASLRLIASRVMRRSLCAIAAVSVVHAVQAQGIPTAGEVIARYEAAVGGRAALDAHSTMRQTGTVAIIANNVRGTIEILRAKPNWYIERMIVSGVGEILTGYDGKIAWEVSAVGAALLTDDDADAVRSVADWYNDFRAPQALRVARVDSVTFEYQRAWRLTYAATLGVEAYVYFDRTTGFRIGESTNVRSGTTIVLGSYRNFGGVMFPTVRTTRARGVERVVTITNVEFDRVDAAAFALPPAVRAIAK